MREHLRTLQAQCLNRGFHQGRAFELRSRRDGVRRSTEDEILAQTTAADSAHEESRKSLERILETYEEMVRTIATLEEDLL